ncbi:hypothetical protein STENM327S_04633 [Streptomyces tendae]
MALLWSPSSANTGTERTVGTVGTEERDAVGSRRGAAAERRRTKPAVIGSVAAVVVAGAGFGAYAVYGGGVDGEDTAHPAAAAEKVKSGPLTAAEVTSTAQRFLTAWQRGDVAGAAAATGRRRGCAGTAHRLHQGRPHQGRHLHRRHPGRGEGPVLRQGHQSPTRRRPSRWRTTAR